MAKLKPKVKRPSNWSWTQPCCAECWVALRVKIGLPAPLTLHAFCCYCRAEITDGKGYNIRINPGAVPYPTVKKDEE
jgi:hypothetical protein